MAGDDDVVRRAGEHLAHASHAPALPELHRVTLDDLGLSEGIECDLGCDYMAVDEQLDGWATPALDGGREAIPSYVICDACKDSWERGDWDRLDDVAARRDIVADLAYLSNDTVRAEQAFDRWDRAHETGRYEPPDQGRSLGDDWDDPWDR